MEMLCVSLKRYRVNFLRPLPYAVDAAWQLHSRAGPVFSFHRREMDPQPLLAGGC